jgi:hypothetical protein
MSTSLGDDVAVPAFGLSNPFVCVCCLSMLMFSFSVLPCVSFTAFSFVISNHTSIHSSSLFDEETICLSIRETNLSELSGAHVECIATMME